MSNETTATHAQPAMTPLIALATVIGVVVVIAVFLAVCHVLGITEYWAGFLFVLYWGMIEKVEVSRLPATIVGGVVGLLLGFATPLLTGVMGEAAGLVFLVIVLVVIFCMLMGWLKIAINAMTMIFLTVATIPAVAEQVAPFNAMAGFATGVVFFAGFICAGKALKARKQRVV
ncbi:hypothetical protein G8770_08750 [Aestuariicella hydrocarbonica]|uniref:DUF1097 domain-containing protein n=1 Tax=Pseudomaricurvus hydrocarbonicus TaxID=1470433 RepID=A0A9E5JZP4_9GAMM|nr:hypothetical protein [Aestuariicella hydrocarbonica]NHO65627.1 hypothetical protein [Aestuariicella hydrocarbonica]